MNIIIPSAFLLALVAFGLWRAPTPGAWMRPWIKLLPWFVVVWLARRHCEVFMVHGTQAVCPFPGVTISK